MPIPTTNNQSAGCQWLILNKTPKLVKENDSAPVMNANFFIFHIIIFPRRYGFSVSPRFYNGCWSPFFQLSFFVCKELLIIDLL